MEWLVFIHVATAIIGLGPTFFTHTFFRNNQTAGDLKQSFYMLKYLMPFPKFVGTLAVLSGILLVILDGWKFAEFWIWGSLVLYIIIQIIIVGIATPIVNKVTEWTQEVTAGDTEQLPASLQASVQRLNRLLYVVSGLTVVIIILMVIKPIFS